MVWERKAFSSDFPNLETIQVPHPPLEDVRVEVKNEQTEHAYSVAVATAAVAAQAAAEVFHILQQLNSLENQKRRWQQSESRLLSVVTRHAT